MCALVIDIANIMNTCQTYARISSIINMAVNLLNYSIYMLIKTMTTSLQLYEIKLIILQDSVDGWCYAVSYFVVVNTWSLNH